MADRLGAVLAQQHIRLVYGGGNVGLMGVLANSALKNGGEVLGIIPEYLRQKEVHHEGLTRLEVVASMHERKALMVDSADGFIALPGGFGTLDEMFETLTWSQLGHHQKPIGLINVEGFYDLLLSFIDQAVQRQLIKQSHEKMLLVETDAVRLIDLMNNYEPPSESKWQ